MDQTPTPPRLPRHGVVPQSQPVSLSGSPRVPGADSNEQRRLSALSALKRMTDATKRLIRKGQRHNAKQKVNHPLWHRSKWGLFLLAPPAFVPTVYGAYKFFGRLGKRVSEWRIARKSKASISAVAEITEAMRTATAGHSSDPVLQGVDPASGSRDTHDRIAALPPLSLHEQQPGSPPSGAGPVGATSGSTTPGRPASPKAGVGMGIDF